MKEVIQKVAGEDLTKHDVWELRKKQTKILTVVYSL